MHAFQSVACANEMRFLRKLSGPRKENA